MTAREAFKQALRKSERYNKISLAAGLLRQVGPRDIAKLNDQGIPISVVQGVGNKFLAIYGTAATDMQKAIQKFTLETVQDNPDCEALLIKEIQKRAKEAYSALSKLIEVNQDEQAEALQARKEFQAVVGLASFITNKDLRSTGKFIAVASVLGWDDD